MVKETIFAVTLGFIFYLHLFLNPWFLSKEYRTKEAFMWATKGLLVVVHILVFGLVMFIFVSNGLLDLL